MSTDDYTFLIDGVILNKTELLGEAGQTSILDLIPTLLHQFGVKETLALLRGPFSGAILDRRARVLYSFGNQTGESAAFAHRDATGPTLSNSFDIMMRMLREAGAPITFDEHAASVMLSYGFMIDDHTFAQEITRIAPGCVISIDLEGGALNTEVYWSLKNDVACSVSTIVEAVSELDRLFRRAVKRCFDKDIEYGYGRHLVDLSGGMDARMVNIVARDLGYSSITNVTYSESRTTENRYAMRLAKQLGNDCLYHPMDGGRSALAPEQNLRLNSGMAFYSGITGGAFVLKSLNFTEFGLEHTGQIGDAVIGTFLSSPERRPPAPGTGAFSKVNTYPRNLHDAVDEELFIMSTRVFRGAMSSHLLRQHFTFAVSPYSDVDLLDFMFSLPLEWRIGHKIFALWIKSCYPGALAVPTTRLLPFRVNPVRHVQLFARKATGVLSRRAQNWLGQRNIPGSVAISRLGNSMNPLESWYAVNPKFRELVLDSSQKAREIPANDALQESLRKSFGKSSSIWDKVLGVTAVAMYEMYFAAFERQASA
ncbi:hypothetical protein E3O11_09895 [Cryobacterium levicorallinum]|uniref:asparagine synthase (glutamine-hydrolyzing) n=1 Tax=Cryobacterium levicorallinum TaxID=995038 RepID=A0A4V3IAN9_9MICO|nr:hypothetical protein [Cryobacterium levicorallinum]TFB84342.1 hypothetical protein E3O11_09895 [Cryobacterium levicorallinum]